MKSKFLGELPESVRNEILSDVDSALRNSDLTESQRAEAFTDARDSRVCDLEDLIDIKKYG